MKEKITEISIQLFEKKGFSETSIQDICDALSVSKGTFYYYFTSKEELLMDIQVRYINEICQKQLEILNDTKMSDRMKLFEIIRMLIGLIRESGACARVFFRERRHLSPERLAYIVKKRNDFRLNLEELLAHGVGAGEFCSTLNVTIATLGILGMTNWSYQWFDPEGALSETEVARIFSDMILHGIE